MSGDGGEEETEGRGSVGYDLKGHPTSDRKQDSCGVNHLWRGRKFI